MSRPSGRRNADFDASRRKLLERIVKVVMQRPAQSSFAELAAASGVSRTTLRHYFGSREELLDAVLEHLEGMSRNAPTPRPQGELDLRSTLERELRRFVVGWRAGVGALFVAGLLWGLDDAQLGRSYVVHLLEPLLASFEAGLVAHVRRKVTADEARYAALSLVSPLVVVMLHQDALHGAACRPLDIDAYLDVHLDGFLRGWFPSGAG